jgi:hypothetical protein
VKNAGYHSGTIKWHIRKNDEKDTFLSNAIPECDDKQVNINILYQGPSNKVPAELLEKLLCTGDSSYNPLRPFRWYKHQIGGNTNDPKDLERARNESFGNYLKEIENPETIFIYEMEIEIVLEK